MMEGEVVKDSRTLAKLQSVESMIPKPADNQLSKSDPHIGEAEYKIIEDCLKMDGTIEQGCMLAGISVPSYYKHREKNPDFARRMDIARQFPKMIARAAIQKRILLGDSKTALEYLKLRDKFYKQDQNLEELGEGGKKAQIVQFISVPSNEGKGNTTSHDSQMNTKQESVGPGYASSGEAEKMTPWENEEQALRNIDSLSFSNG